VFVAQLLPPYEGGRGAGRDIFPHEGPESRIWDHAEVRIGGRIGDVGAPARVRMGCR